MQRYEQIGERTFSEHFVIKKRVITGPSEALKFKVYPDPSVFGNI